MTQFPIPTDHSMEALPEDSRIRQLYPDDLFPNGKFQSLYQDASSSLTACWQYSIGHYASLPHGRVRYWIIGPENGTKVVYPQH